MCLLVAALQDIAPLQQLLSGAVPLVVLVVLRVLSW